MIHLHSLYNLTNYNDTLKTDKHLKHVNLNYLPCTVSDHLLSYFPCHSRLDPPYSPLINQYLKNCKTHNTVELEIHELLQWTRFTK